MSVITGYSGQIDWGATLDSDTAYNTHSWSLDVTADIHDITDFTTSGWRKQTAGLKGWSGTMEIYVDDTVWVETSHVGANVALKLYLNDTKYFSGNAICSGIHPAVSVDGIETQTIDFAGSSDLSFT